MPKFDLSISLVSHNSSLLLENCLKSIYENTKDVKFEIFLVDNASSDDTIQMVEKKFKDVKLTINSENALYTKAHNQNLKKISGRYFLVLNDDTIIHPNTIESIIAYLDTHPYIGLASCRQIDEHGKTDTTCSRFPHPLTEVFESSFVAKQFLKIVPILKVKRMVSHYRYSGWKRNTIREVDVIPGSFFLGRKILLEKVGLFDENLKLFYSDTDLCWRIKKAGYKLYHFADVAIIHLRAQTVNKLNPWKRYKLSENDMLYFYKKYYGFAWWLFLWLAFRPNWLYWKLVTFKNNEV